MFERKSQMQKSAIPLEDGLLGAQRELDALWAALVGAAAGAASTRVLFVGAGHGCGTTTVAAAVALGLARNLASTVALVEANPYTPCIARYLGMSQGPGITDVLDGACDAASALRPGPVPRLLVATAGGPRLPRRGDLARPELTEVLDRAAAAARFTIVDGPPVLDHPAASVLLGQVDQAVIVVHAGRTSRAAAQGTLRWLEEAGLPTLGTVLNGFRDELPFGLGARRCA